VLAGLGIGFLSLHAVGPEVRSGMLRIVDFEDTPLMRTWNIVNEASKVLSPAAEAFRYFVLEHAETLMGTQDAAALKPANVLLPS
jgi:DNA-binding transcriptional LysR family regulator